MNAEADRFVSVCKPQFEALFTRVNTLDEAVRGNGKPGLNQRVRDLERCEGLRGKLFWIAVGLAVSVIGSVVSALAVAHVMRQRPVDPATAAPAPALSATLDPVKEVQRP
jgi:hypothetical protein